MNKEKSLSIIIAIVCLILTISAISINTIISENASKLETEINRSVYNKNPSGYAAWYKVLTISGLSPKIWKNSFSKLDNDLTSFRTLVITTPKTSNKEYGLFSGNETSHLLNWVRKGNTLIFIDNFESYNTSSFIKGKLNLKYKIIQENNNDEPETSEDKNSDENKKNNEENEENTDDISYSTNKYIFPVDATKHKDLSFKVKHISSTSKVRINANNIEPILSDKHGIILGKRIYGMGQIYILSLPDIADNDSLYESENNYQFLTNLVTINGKDFVINEYVHGVIEKEGFIEYLASTILDPIFKQLVLLFTVLIWSVSRRFGRPRSIEETKRNTNLEYVDAIANIYRSANLTGTALKSVYNDFRHKLVKDLKVNPNITQENLFEIIDNSFTPLEATEIKETYIKAQKNIDTNSISKKDMLDLCKKMNNYRLKGIRYATKC